MKKRNISPAKKHATPYYRHHTHILNPSPGTTIGSANKPQLSHVISPPATPHPKGPPATFCAAKLGLFPRQRPSRIGKLTRPRGETKSHTYANGSSERLKRSALLHLIDFPLPCILLLQLLDPLPSCFSNNTYSSTASLFLRPKIKRPRHPFATLRLPRLPLLFLSSAQRKVILGLRRIVSIVQKFPSPGNPSKMVTELPCKTRTLLSLFPSTALGVNARFSLRCRFTSNIATYFIIQEAHLS